MAGVNNSQPSLSTVIFYNQFYTGLWITVRVGHEVNHGRGRF